MVLLHVLYNLGVSIKVAHCNFKLRGKESDEDERFVHRFCLKQKIDFYSKSFDTNKYSISNKLSIQMAARKLRYDWFEKLLLMLEYNYVAIGHHLNDSIETFFINLIRGTGKKGLLGISEINGKIIRPILSFTKEDILKYAKENKIEWREDSSNKSIKYLRNNIRKHIEPFKNIPNFYNGFRKTIHNLSYEYLVLENQLKIVIKNITIKKSINPFIWKINSEILSSLEPIIINLLFLPYGFKNLKDLIRFLNTQSGKQLFSKHYRLIKDRNCIILTKKYLINKKVYNIFDLSTISDPIYMSFSISIKIDKLATASVDLDMLKFPLKLRIWKKGDYFYPLGMHNKKKISKYLKDEKLSLLEKEKIYLLVNSTEEIILVLGKRLDDRFKVTNNTKNVLNININNYECW
ncbi:MAG: tRNA lysidine(34) synthetase TilS [Candidatus Bostrichicola ureolyticus]|nr:MAG: tRNA lysidine(34) synthetase TilS [Candidatus Bostrichicola ureolyticus]